MIPGSWREPNFRCDAIDLRGRARRWLTHGSSADAVRERVEAKGWTVEAVVPYDFGQWRRRAQQALATTREAHEQTGRATFTDAVWGDLKQHLFELFHGKCAYCESRVLHVDYGDVEHYRPRGRVEEDATHPGYWWLAYETENLLPSCGLCNGPGGKWDQFPLDGGEHVRAPGSLAGEQPLLLNPYEPEHPRTHLRFLPRGGVEGRTPRGERTIEICGLRRLRDERAAAQQQLARDMWVDAVVDRPFTERCLERMEQLLRGEEEHSAALVDHVLHMIDEEERRVQDARVAARAMVDQGRG